MLEVEIFLGLLSVLVNGAVTRPEICRGPPAHILDTFSIGLRFLNCQPEPIWL